MAENKTEQATPRRQKKAREMGQIARSRELPAALALIAAAAPLVWLGHTAVAHWGALYRYELDAAATEDLRLNSPTFYWSAVEVLRLASPILLAALAVSMVASLGQGGLNFAPQALSLRFERLNPATKLGQIFSSLAINNLLKSLIPFAALVWIAYSALKARWNVIIHAGAMGTGSIASTLGSMLFEITWKACLVLLAWSAVDYVFTWRKIQNDLKMTKQEVREDMKDSDGNPAIKQRIRQIQRQLRKKRSVKDAAKATVIVTNPTHYAVALRYETEMVAPVVVAKGLDVLAEQIKEIGRENGIMMVENRPLAQALYKSVEVGECIPVQLYEAVAEILAFVYRAQEEVRRKEAERSSKNASGQVVQKPNRDTGGKKQ